MAIITSTSGLMEEFRGKSLQPIYKVINDKGADWESKLCVLKDVYCEEKSSNFAEKIVDEVGMGDYKPTEEGSAYPTTDMQAGYSSVAEHVEWKNRMEITQTMFEDNKTSAIKKKAGLFSKSYHRSREKFRAQMLGGGKGDSISLNSMTFSTKACDGLSLFNIAHKSKIDSGLTQSNRFTDAFTDDGLGYISEKMQNFVDDKGDVVGVSPDTIIIGNYHALKKQVFAVIGADKDPGSGNNGFNYQFGLWRVIVSPLLNAYLTKDEFILMDSKYNEDASGAVWFDRIANEVETFQAETTRNLIIAGRSRFSAVFHDWRTFAIGGTETGTTIQAGG